MTSVQVMWTLQYRKQTWRMLDEKQDLASLISESSHRSCFCTGEKLGSWTARSPANQAANHGRPWHTSPFNLNLKGAQFQRSLGLHHRLYALSPLRPRNIFPHSFNQYLVGAFCVPDIHVSSTGGHTVTKKMHQVFVIVELKEGKNSTRKTMCLFSKLSPRC